MNRVLIIGHNWPEPSTTAAGHRMIQLIHAFLHFDWPVTFVSTAAKTEYSFDLEVIGVETDFVRLNHSSFDEFLKKVQPKYVVFDRFMVEEQFGWRVAEHVPNAIRILNTEDLHSVRKTREKLHKKGEGFTLEKWKDEDITKREIASIYRSDLSLIISTFEMKILREELQIPENLLVHLPFMLEEVTEATRNSWPKFEERIGFITYGNGKHAPNLDSIMYLKKVIWPRIRKELPDVTIKIFGGYLPQQIREMHSPKEGFIVQGWVQNLDLEIQKAKIVLAPLRFGAGIKGKVIDSAKHGTPFVTTRIGTEGMSLNVLPSQCVNSDSPGAFVDSAIQLYSNEELWHKAQELGLDSINKRYSKTKKQIELHKILEKLSENISVHRRENFIGSMLQHQTLAATKYMAKWIEKKNR
ncbi:MAG: glycosyltransferase family 4 protein [Bacteroidota bacterium]